jgi:hypothetical protein
MKRCMIKSVLPPKIGAHKSKPGTQAGSKQSRGKADPKRRPGSIQDTREHIPAKGIRAKPMFRVRGLKHGAIVVGQRIERRDEIRQKRGNDHDGNDERAERAERTLAGKPGRYPEPITEPTLESAF